MVSDKNLRTFFINNNNAGHESAKSSIKQLLGTEQFVPEFSFIADFMCFNKFIVAELIEKVEKNFNNEFYKSAMLIEQNSDARFSEYELYGVFSNYSKNKQEASISSYINFSPRDLGRNKLRFVNFDFRLKRKPFVTFSSN